MSSQAASSLGGEPAHYFGAGPSNGHAALGRGFPSSPQQQQQQQPGSSGRPIVGLRTVTGEKRKRAQSESRQEQEEAEGPVSRQKCERPDSQDGLGGSTGAEDSGENGDDTEGGANSLDTLTFETGLSDDENGGGGSDDEDGSKKPRGSTGAMVMDKNGRKKIQIKYIEDKSRRHITFSKRKAGIMKKAFELSTLTGTQVLLLVVSETGLVYTFTTSKLQPLVTKPEGKNLIQACLNAPTGEAPGGGPSGPGGMTTGNRSRSSTTPGLPIRHKDDTIEYGPDPTPSLAMPTNGGLGMPFDAPTSAPASRKVSLSAGPPPRKPRASGGSKSRKVSVDGTNLAAAAAASAHNGNGNAAGPAAAPPITGDMLKRREIELARRDSAANGLIDAGLGHVPQEQQQQQHSLQQAHAHHSQQLAQSYQPQHHQQQYSDPQLHQSPLPPQHSFMYQTPPLGHQQQQHLTPQQQQPTYSPHGSHHPQPPPHLTQPAYALHQQPQYAPPQHHQQQQQQPHPSPQQHQEQQHPSSPAHPSHPQHQPWLRQMGRPTYPPPSSAPPLHLQMSQSDPSVAIEQEDFGAQQQAYAYGGVYEQQQQPGMPPSAVGLGDPQAILEAGGGGGGSGGQEWPSSIYNS